MTNYNYRLFESIGAAVKQINDWNHKLEGKQVELVTLIPEGNFYLAVYKYIEN